MLPKKVSLKGARKASNTAGEKKKLNPDSSSGVSKTTETAPTVSVDVGKVEISENVHWEQQNFAGAWVRITPHALSDAIEGAYQSFRSVKRKPPKVTAPYDGNEIVCYFATECACFERLISGNAVDQRNIRRVVDGE